MIVDRIQAWLLEEANQHTTSRCQRLPCATLFTASSQIDVHIYWQVQYKCHTKAYNMQPYARTMDHNPKVLKESP